MKLQDADDAIAACNWPAHPGRAIAGHCAKSAVEPIGWSNAGTVWAYPLAWPLINTTAKILARRMLRHRTRTHRRHLERVTEASSMSLPWGVEERGGATTSP
jgi:hypothetical protein